MVKYYVTPETRHDCPHALWPDDPYVGRDRPWHQVASDIDAFPLLGGHFYHARVVFDAAKAHVQVDIFADHLGPAGDDAGEPWAGFRNIGIPGVADSAGCKYGAVPGQDEMATEDQPATIGAPVSHGDVPRFAGRIDWLRWRPAVDYAGLDDPAALRDCCAKPAPARECEREGVD